MDKQSILEAEAVLAGLPRFADRGGPAYKPGLERMERLLAVLGRPHEAYETVHVAGTNGKGSTASFLASIASAAGFRVGLHTSPHLFHVTERMRVDGRAAPPEWLAASVHRVRPLLEEIEPSYFELTAALSFLYFAERGADLAVVEVGMGGRLDATNVIQPILSVITDIGLDHTEFLGDTIEAVAAEKAGIVKPGVPVAAGTRPPATDVIRRAAALHGGPFHAVREEVEWFDEHVALRGSTVTVRTPLRMYPEVQVGLAGRHQIFNAVTALRGAELAFDTVARDPRPALEGIRRVRELSGLRGRFEVLREHPLVLADVAHNADGLAVVVDHLSACGALEGRVTVLLGAMRDKDIREMGRILAAAHATVRPVAVASDRALSPGELATQLEVVNVNVDEPCTVQEGVEAFLTDASPTDTLLVTGSHLVVAQLKDAIS